MADVMAARKLRIDPGRALIPVSLGLFFVLRFVFHVPTWALAVLLLWIPVYYLGIPWLAGRRWHAFEREFAYRYPQGDHKSLLSFWQGQFFLRQFGPKPLMLEKLALIYQALGRVRDAETVLERAVELADKRMRPTFLPNLAHVKYELGKYDEAEPIYRRLLRRFPHNTAAQTRLALIHIHTGHDIDASLTVLRAQLGRAQGEELRRIEEAIVVGERART
jgi:tetratricopeptide (TPR) repeat protein